MAIPRNDDDMFNFQGKLVDTVEANKVAWGIPNAAVDALAARRAEYEPLYHKAQNKGDRTAGDVTRHRNMRRVYEKEIRAFVAFYLSPNPAVPADMLVEMGIPRRDPKPTTVPPEYVGSLEPPNLILNWSKRAQVKVHFGVNPANERRNAKPVHIAGAKIWYRIESGPWVWIADDTNSPYDHYFSITEPQNVEYQAQWIDKKGRTGGFGDSAKCTVTP